MKRIGQRNVSHKWHVRQLYKLRKWKDPRAELRNIRGKIKYRMHGKHQLQRLLRAIKADPAIMACNPNGRISSPTLRIEKLSYRLGRRRQARPRQESSS